MDGLLTQAEHAGLALLFVADLAVALQRSTVSYLGSSSTHGCMP